MGSFLNYVTVCVVLLLSIVTVFEHFTIIDVEGFLQETSSTNSFLSLNSFSQERSYNVVDDLEFYFCNGNNYSTQYPCFNAFNETFSLAHNSIVCALYELDEEKLTDTIITKVIEDDIIFKLIIDDTYLDESSIIRLRKNGIEVFSDENSGNRYNNFMHEKFCIIDNSTVLFGSMNPTTNGLYFNDNVVAKVNSQEVAQEFYAEFSQLYSNTFSTKKEPSSFTNTIYTTSHNTSFEILFCPQEDCEKKLVSLLNLSNSSIHFATFVLTLDSVEEMLVSKHNQGVSVLGVSEPRLSNTKGSRINELKEIFPIRKDTNTKTMHHKLFIVDSKYSIFGSMNPTKSGANYNDEFLVIVNSSYYAKEFEEEFFRVYNASVEFD